MHSASRNAYIAMSVLVMGARWAIGAPIAYDGFAYAEGDLAGNHGGSGWTGAWHDVHPDGRPKTFIALPGMEHSDDEGARLATVGGQVGIAYDTSRRIDLDAEARPDLAAVTEDGKLGATGATVWISLLARNESGYGWAVVELNDGSREQVKLCHAGDSENWGFIDTATRETDTPVDEQAFMVARIDFRGPEDDIYLWTNPDLTTEPDIANADARGAYPGASFDTVVIRGDATDETYIDELRIGTTWADVRVRTE